MSQLRLEGKVAIITGAASGIGEAAARLFAENGALVIIADVQDELGHQVVVSIGPDRSCYVHCDVRDEKQVQGAVDLALEKYERLDVMFSNAGIGGPLNGIMELDMGALDNAMAINVRGVVATIKHAARAMVERKTRGSIICTASVSAVLGGSAPHAYTISKHALVGVVRSTAAELGKYGIKVNCISPFALATPMTCTGRDPIKMEEHYGSLSNLKGVVLKPRHVAQAALFLASDESPFVSGHNLVLDGGFSVVNNCFSFE
ncbi:short-chain dehydrogenase reductase 3b-like [Magnolia sinica]|uniref:short-chain dehydrogenase reductase 3b-like n=1 Tax=Magnolia sinica TaxID=86752 RepID=UPI00265A6EE4|nr:short-chain dehydrogenase reductase 3b-like [Magnolia sinica]